MNLNLQLHKRAVLAGLALTSAVCLSGCGIGTWLPWLSQPDAPEPVISAETAVPVPAVTEAAPDLTALTAPPVTTYTTDATVPLTSLTSASAAPVTEITIGEIPVPETTAPPPEPDEHGLTPQDYAFLHDTVFVGDSICSGLRVYGILPDDNVVAKGSVGVRNIFENKFPVREREFGVSYSLYLLEPRYVVFSMGMNDIRMTTEEEYCNNYDFLMDTLHTVLPDTKFFVASITPVTADCEFTDNDRIDRYNEAMKTHLESREESYVDIASCLKMWDNTMYPEYSGGDGIHLVSSTYYIILNSLCDSLVDTRIVGGWQDGIAYGWAKKN